MRSIIPAILVIGLMQAAIAAQPSSYSKKDMDDKLSAIRKDLLEQFRQEMAKIQRPVTKEQIEAALGGSGYTKTEIDNALNQLRSMIPQQFVTQTQLDARLAKTDADAKDREQELRKASKDNLPTVAEKVAPWVAIGVSILSLGASIRTASQNRQLTLQDANIKRSWEIQEDWRSGIGQQHADAVDYLESNRLEGNFTTITDVANWLIKVVTLIKTKLVDERITDRAEIRTFAILFLDALESNKDVRLDRAKADCGPIRDFIGR